MARYELTPRTILLMLLSTLLTVGFAASIVVATDVYLLLFLAILCSVFFSQLAGRLGKLSPLPYEANLSIIVATTVVLTLSVFFFFGWRIDRQIERTSDELDASYAKVVTWIEQSPTATGALRRFPFTFPAEASPKLRAVTGKDEADASSRGIVGNNLDDVENDTASTGWASIGAVNSVSGKVFGVLGKMFSTSLGVSMNVAFVFFVGVFLAARPHFYRDSFANLFPKPRRGRVLEILDRIGDTLFDWLQGRAATMVITGTGTSLVLWLLGVPLALTLGIITGLLTFIPTIGGFIALVLSMLVALAQGPATVAWVVLLYAMLQFIESNVITPLIQQHQTSVPPPVLLTSQLMMGVLTGFLGVMVSTPLVASLIVLVQEAYVADVLEASQPPHGPLRQLQ